MNGPGQDNEYSKSVEELKIPNQYDNVDWGKRTKLVVRKVSTKERGGKGKFYGAKAIVTKEGEKLTFADFLIAEAEDVTLLPQRIVDELKKLIREGAKDLTQNWKDALHLVNTAYHVGNVRRPVPEEKGAWKQYEDLIRFSVKQLSSTRGIDGKWRSSTVLVREDLQQQPPASAAPVPAQPQPTSPAPRLSQFVQRDASDNHIGSKRYFVEIPGHAAVEIDGKNMDEIIEMIHNKMRRHGAKIRVEERQKEYAIITVWVHDVKRDRIIIKQVSQ